MTRSSQGDFRYGRPERPVLAKATYFLGFATRQTVDLFRIVFGLVSIKAKSRRTPSSARRSRIAAGLSKMQSRLESIETAVFSRRRRRPSHRPSHLADAEDVSAFIESAGNPDPGVRRFALGAISGRVSRAVEHVVIESLHDPDPTVRAAAAGAAAKASISSAVFSLIILLTDPSDDVVQAAQSAIHLITGRRVNFDPRESETTRNKKIEMLKVWWKENRFAHLAKGLDPNG